MITAIVMINCEIGKVNEVAEALVDLDGIGEVYSVSGEWDILAIVRVKEYDSLAQVVSKQMTEIGGITRTNTHMAFRCYSKHNMEKMWSEFISQ
jgi:DNA-binding Lrp family transcriptional regulator